MDSLITLVPTYGLYIIFASVYLACLGAPIPSSVLVLTAGSFVAAGQLSLIGVGLTVFAAYCLGDQTAFRIAQRYGPHLLSFFRRSDRARPVLEKSEALLQRQGSLAVFLSHTILSPTCPYVSYLAGAGGLSWPSFSFAAVLGAMVWTSIYIALGMAFATQLEAVVTTLSHFFGFVFAGVACLGCLWVLQSRWRAMHQPLDA